MKHSYPRAALREIAGLLVGNQRSYLDPSYLEKPYGYMIEELVKLQSPLERAERVDTLCLENGIDPDTFHLALSSEDVSSSSSRYWPKPLRPEAFHGPIGIAVREVERHTEADPAGILLSLLTSLGSSVGRGPHIEAGGFHHLNEYVCLVGESSHARKGTGWTVASRIMRQIDKEWVDENIQAGISTGEGLINLVHDEITKEVWSEEDGDYRTERIAGEIQDKRVHFWVSELGSVLQVMSRPGATLPATLREAWDGGKLGNINKSSPLTATNAHISIVSAITIAELMYLIGESDVVNGFANRFLWCLVRKQRNLPHGGGIPNSKAFERAIGTLKANISYARDQVRQVAREQDSYPYWEKLYNSFDLQDTYGIHRSVTSRGIQHIIRLSIIYAVAEGKEIISEQHIRSAVAVWDYCSESARIIFGESTGNKTADLILDDMRSKPEMGFTIPVLKEKFAPKEPNYVIDRALMILESAGLADCMKEPVGTGQFVEVWYYSRH